ncbi:MAG: ScpA family protein [Deinococcales bacterium]
MMQEALQDPLATTSFRVMSPSFEGTLAELIQALRSERVGARAVNLLSIVRDYLNYYQRLASKDLQLATETLPQLAKVIELKTRLLLPRLPKESDEENLEETLSAIEMLADIEHAIHFLRQRRDERKLIISAKTPKPDLPRLERALNIGIQRLNELASRYQVANYFELSRDRLTMPEAMKNLKTLLTRWGNHFFHSLAPKAWAERVVYFSAMLELIKESQIYGRQEEAFGDIELANQPLLPIPESES